MTYRKEDFFYQTAGKGQLYTQEAPITEDKILMHPIIPTRLLWCSLMWKMPATVWTIKAVLFMMNIRINRRLNGCAGESAKK